MGDIQRSSLLTLVVPTEKRKKRLDGDIQEYLTEGAVMLAFALHLLESTTARRIEIHPDGEHGKRFPFQAQLNARGFEKVRSIGKTDYGGLYRDPAGAEIEINPKAGLGDIVVISECLRIVAEAKGGIVNTRNAGPVSRMRRGLCEAVGLLMSRPRVEGTRHIAVVPDVPVTRKLAQTMVARTQEAGIEIALVDRHGAVTAIAHGHHSLSPELSTKPSC